MEDNENLDNLITNSSDSLQSPNISKEFNENRPRLRKIKRPKIRPISDVPQPPRKEVDIALDQNDVQPISDGVDSGVDVVSDETSSRTDLITSKDALDLTTEKDFRNSYVLEGLPPELDYVTDEDGNVEYLEKTTSKKKIIWTSVASLLVGIFLGASLFASKTEEKHGLEGVVLNPDVPAGRARCGLTDKSQACTFYIMNCYKQELTGRDFYKLAAQLTSREEYMIETENLRYAMVKIKPGHFAQINIPALK